MHRLVIWLFLLSLLSLPLAAQTLSKAERSMHALIESGFLEAYKDYRYEAEMHVAMFKARERDFSPVEVAGMRVTYGRTAEAFEDFIYRTRNDLLDKRTRKDIRKDSETYVRQRLEDLRDVYQKHYQERFLTQYRHIAGGEPLAQGGRVNSLPPTIPLALITPVAQATLSVIEMLESRNARDLAYMKELLEKEWIQPHQFRPWEEI